MARRKALPRHRIGSGCFASLIHSRPPQRGKAAQPVWSRFIGPLNGRPVAECAFMQSSFSRSRRLNAEVPLAHALSELCNSARPISTEAEFLHRTRAAKSPLVYPIRRMAVCQAKYDHMSTNFVAWPCLSRLQSAFFRFALRRVSSIQVFAASCFGFNLAGAPYRAKSMT